MLKCYLQVLQGVINQYGLRVCALFLLFARVFHVVLCAADAAAYSRLLQRLRATVACNDTAILMVYFGIHVHRVQCSRYNCALLVARTVRECLSAMRSVECTHKRDQGASNRRELQ
jgi:hypothetical protein